MRPWPCCLASQTSQRVNARQRERGLEHQRTAGFQHIHNSHSQTASINKVVWAPFSLSTLPGQLTLHFKYNEAIRRMIDNAVAGELLGRRRRRRSRGWPDRNTGLAESSFKQTLEGRRCGRHGCQTRQRRGRARLALGSWGSRVVAPT
jgi:hypothetical protein